MAKPILPYICNVEARVVHRRFHLTEQCNTDAIKRRRNATLVPKGYTRCEHCHQSYTEETE